MDETLTAIVEDVSAEMDASTLDEPVPRVQVLSNGRLVTLATAAGGGGTWLRGRALTRWQPDRTRDACGTFVYVQDLDDGQTWSAGHQPVRREADDYAAEFVPGRLRIRRRDRGVVTTMEVCVAPDDDVELRRCTLENTSGRPRRLALVSYAEVVLNDPVADASHPAFSKLFVQTEHDPETGSLLARRRLRSPDEEPVWLVHTLAGATEAVTYETDRRRFVGRGRSVATPQALDGGELSHSVGPVLDPVVSFRTTVTLAPGEQVTLTFGTGGASDGATARLMSNRYGDPAAVAYAFEEAEGWAWALHDELGLDEATARSFDQLAGALYYDRPDLRHIGAFDDEPLDGAGAVAFGLAGEHPLVVVHGAAGEEAVRQVLAAQGYWQRLGVETELVVVGSERLDAAVHGDAEAAGAALFEGEPEEVEALRCSARLAVGFEAPAAAAPGRRDGGMRSSIVPASSVERDPDEPGQALLPLDETLQFDNGSGGFSGDGREYVIRVTPDADGWPQLPPLPWSNVVANESIGFLATERGPGYTWSVNSRENRLTPWYNDPVSDPLPEASYVCDEDAGVFWSPTPGPSPRAAPYEVRHGFGYTRWRHRTEGLDQEVVQFVPRHDAVKLTRVRLTNCTDRPRRLSLVHYQRLVLGHLPAQSDRHVATRFDDETDALLAVNSLNGEFATRTTFAAVAASGRPDYTTDRAAFLGRHGDLAAPAAVQSPGRFDGTTGAGLDPCFAWRVPVELAPGESADVTFMLGQVDVPEAVGPLIERYRRVGAVEAELDAVRTFWDELIGRIQIETPAPEIDLMVNGWLVYQNVSCRLWGRSAYYQSGGAYGYRDQLQDAGALVYTWPELAREQILRHVRHQFVEGDVMHWWHPPTSKGIRTRFSDDLLWLPYLTAHYVQATGDAGVLDEEECFLTARLLEEGEDEVFLTPEDSGVRASVFEHCCRAIDRSLTRGRNGLPLMGVGDWNDGMNRVGRLGRGESVWLGFFLYAILEDFIPLCRERGEAKRAERYAAYRTHLYEALNDAGWDGAWYRRAYYDDGAPIGSSESDECRIDALAQGWAVLSGAAPPERAEQALDALEKHLVDEEAGLIRLLTPAFDQTPHDPGYIKGYVPGVRENGGQYTHGVLWAVRALAEAGRGDRAGALLRMLSPVAHGRTPGEVETYMTEPYVVAADVYGEPPHVGRGGWTWYTGSAGWMYRVALESLLGVRVEDGHTLVVAPCIPSGWPGFTVCYRLPHDAARYTIEVRNPDGVQHGVAAVEVDGEPQPVAKDAARVRLASDRREHRVVVILGA